MLVKEYRDKLFDLSHTCVMNHRYHQAYELYWGRWDKSVKAILAILTVIGLVLSVPQIDLPWTDLWFAIAIAFIAFFMNIVPVGDWEKEHGEMFRLWSDLRNDCDVEGIKVTLKAEFVSVPSHYEERVMELVGKANALHAMERFPNVWFLKRCQQDESIRRHSVQPATVSDQEPTEGKLASVG